MVGTSPSSPRPPLRVVLGTLASDEVKSSSTCSAESSSAVEGMAITAMDQQSHNITTYILGTSSYSNSRLALGSGLRLKIDGRVPMEDRKTPFSQFRPRSLLLSTFRVTAINISSTLSTYFSDQLQFEQRNEQLADDGEITPYEADEMNEEWENREWQKRMDLLPRKIGVALIRFHACTALMRFYEFITGRYILCVDRLESGSSGRESSYEHSVDVMDKLTRDPFQASLRTPQLLHNQEHSPGKVLSSDGKETSTSRELYKQMYSTCLWANVIPFLAELSVQYGVLLYGYGVYYMEKKKRRKKREEMSNDDGANNDEDDEKCEEDDAESVDETAYALSIFFRSTHLTVSRFFSWIAASAGGAAGSVIYPGWGAVLGNQIGDSLVGALLD